MASYTAQNPLNYQGGQVYGDNGQYVYQKNGESQYWNEDDLQQALAQQQSEQQRGVQSGLQLTGITPYTGAVTYGRRGDVGGENSTWAVNPKTGKEEAAIKGPGGFYFASDLAQKYGSIQAASQVMDQNQKDENGQVQPMFATSLWGARPSNDTFSGKDGLADLEKIALMASPVIAGAAGLFGSPVAGGAAAVPAGVGDAALAGGFGTDALVGGGETLGGGLSTGSTATGIGAGATGTGLTAGTTAGALGEGAIGTGLSGAAAGGALAPGYFAAETAYPVLGGAASAASGIGSGLGGSATAAGLGGLTAADLLRGVPGVLGALAANNQSNQLNNLAHEYLALGAPSRGRYEASFDPGFSMSSDPGFTDALNQSAKATLHGLSIGGNPADSPNAWAASLQDLYQKNAYPALQNYRSTNASAGGLSQLTGAAPAAATGAINAQGNVASSLGGAAADIFTPRTSLADLLKGLRA